jgi:hypothetical protein
VQRVLRAEDVRQRGRTAGRPTRRTTPTAIAAEAG